MKRPGSRGNRAVLSWQMRARHRRVRVGAVPQRRRVQRPARRVRVRVRGALARAHVRAAGRARLPPPPLQAARALSRHAAR